MLSNPFFPRWTTNQPNLTPMFRAEHFESLFLAVLLQSFPVFFQLGWPGVVFILAVPLHQWIGQLWPNFWSSNDPKSWCKIPPVATNGTVRHRQDLHSHHRSGRRRGIDENQFAVAVSSSRRRVRLCQPDFNCGLRTANCHCPPKSVLPLLGFPFLSSGTEE